MNPTPRRRVVAVVVAYNRAALLAEALTALSGQSLPLVATVVIDNASTDDSAEVARRSGADLVRLGRNTGGAGGFAAGLAHALATYDADWVWLMDDDTVPTSSALEALVDAAERAGAVVAGSRVVWTDGSEHPMNTPRPKPMASRRERAIAAGAGSFAIRSTSFVSMLARVDAVRAAGLPIADYFIWNDDFEYSTRLLRRGLGLHVPASVVVHKTRALGSTDVDPGERFYFEVRNKVWMLRHSRGLAAHEKALYGAATVRRWVRTLLRSSDRPTLRDAFARGWRDGWRQDPRSTAAVLAGLPVTSAVERAESSANGAG